MKNVLEWVKEIVIAEYTAQKTTFFSKGTANEIMLKIVSTINQQTKKNP